MAADLARYVLPPGNYGGIPFTANSTDQLPLYSGLSPLRDNITPADIDQHYLPEDFTPIEPSHEEATGRPGLRLVYDAYGIPHVYGQTREDVAFGAGWTTARDRGLLIQLGRGPARVAVADVPNIDAFSLVTSLQTFTPSPAAEALVTKQQQLLIDTYGAKGQEILSDAQAYADGINAYWAANNVNQPPATVNDVIAVTAFIGSIFGAGGGGEAANSNLLAKLEQSLGADQGYKAWTDVMLADDPEAPTTIKRKFKYPVLTGGPVTGSVVLDPDSIQSIDPRQPAALAAAAPARRRASNFLVAAPSRSASHNSLAVMGPQLGYYYPEIVQQIDLHGPGINAQGAAVPGLAMYILIGRTQDYAWSLTSAGHDVRDVYAEQLCETDGSAPTRASAAYIFNGKCNPMDTFNAGTLGTTPLIYHVTIHGPVFATATVRREAVRPLAPPLDVRPRLPQPRCAEGHDRGQGLQSFALLPHREPVRVHLQLGLRVAQGDGLLLLRLSSQASPRARPAPADARHGAVRVDRLPHTEEAPARHQRSRRPAAQLEQPLGARLHAR